MEQSKRSKSGKEKISAEESGRNTSNDMKNLVKNFQNEVHKFQSEIKQLEDEALQIRKGGNLDASDRLNQRANSLREKLVKMEQEAAAIPEIASLLGMAPISDPNPPELMNIVNAAKFETFNVTLKEEERAAKGSFHSEWPRTGGKIENNEIISFETLGKLRMKVRADNGASAGNIPFRITAVSKKDGSKMVLREGRTDHEGYAAVKLNNIETDAVKNVEITLGVNDEGKGSQNRKLDIPEIITHRDLGIAHELTIRDDLLGKLDLAKPLPGTVEDPDDDDFTASPASFGLNPENVDGNCCLRPRTEFPSRQYYFRQIVRLTEPQLVADRKQLNRSEVKGPIPFGGENSGTYAVSGGNLLLGTVNLYRQGWYPAGRGLGELLYSLALAPCEQINLAFIDWSRTERDTRHDTSTEKELLEHEMQHDRSISEVVDSVLTEHQSGSSSSGGGGASLDLGIFSIGGGGGTTSSSTSGRRALHASTLQNISDEVVQRSSALRSQRSTVVTTSSQHESERIQTRTVHNHNRNHAMTVQYFQVLSHYIVKNELIEEKPVVLVPYLIDEDIFDNIPSFAKFVLSPSRRITRFLIRYEHLLRRIVPQKFQAAFDSLNRLMHCGDVYSIEQPYATFSRWNIRLDKAWRAGLTLSIETKSGQSVKLTPRGGNKPVDFVSDPVRADDIDGIRIGFDPVTAAQAVGNTGIFGLLGDSVSDLLEKTLNHKISGIQISARTDRSRFVPQPQSFRLEVAQPDKTLTSEDPFVVADITPPTVSFEGYRGREHEDYCRLKQLIAFIQTNPMRIMRLIWRYEDPDRRALRLDRFVFQGNSLLDSIVNRPVGILGNYVAFELLEGHKLVKLEKPDYAVSSRIISLPTRGVFAEVFLSCCNATEKRDVERYIDPDQKCEVRAPEITGVTPGSRASRSDTTPTPFPSPLVSLQNVPGVPDPGGLSAALGVLGTPNIFRDISHGAELLNFINNATKEAFTSTRQHRAAMDAIAGDIVKGLVSAYTGIPIGGSSGSPSLKSGAGAGSSVGSSAGGSAGGSSVPSLGPKSSSGSSSGSSGRMSSSNPLIAAAAGQAVRNSQPGKVFDMQQLIRRAVDNGDLSTDAGQMAMANLLGSTGGETDIIPAAFVTPASSAVSVPEPVARPCCVLRPSIPGIDNIVEVSDLTNHVYGKMVYPFFEKSGLIYTCKGGFVDLGHARDCIDYTGYLAAQAKAGLSKGATLQLNPDGATRTIRFKGTGQVPSDELCISLGQRISYELAIWHEIRTWFPGSGQRYSSFSPEDNYSNLLGTYMGADALRSPKVFEDAAVDAITTWLNNLKPMPKSDTQLAFNTVKDKWWKENTTPVSADAVLRRHFDALGTVAPWQVPGFAPCGTEAATALMVPDKGPGNEDLASLYFLEFGIPASIPAAVLALTSGGGNSPIVPSDFPALIAHIRADAKKPANFGPNADKP